MNRTAILFGVLSLCAQGCSGQAIPDGSKIYVDTMDGFGRFVVAALNTHAPHVTPVLLEEGSPAESGFRITGESTNFSSRYERYARLRLLDSRGTSIWSYSCRKSRKSFLQLHGSPDAFHEDMRLAAKDVVKQIQKLIGRTV